MMRVSLLLSLAALLCSAQAPKQFSTRKMSDEFVGAWKLVSFERKTTAGEVTYPMGVNPVGRLTYDAFGRMSAQIMRPDGSPIARLYSAGELGSIYSYLYQGTGNIGECLAFGRVSGRNAAAETPWE